MASCTNCGHGLPDGSEFCAFCGAKQAGPGAALCPNCGTELLPGAGFCPKCGRPAYAEIHRAPERTVDISGSTQKETATLHTAQNPMKAGTQPNVRAAGNATRGISSSKFGLVKILIVVALVCFFLPFTLVSCSDTVVDESSGADYMFGETKENLEYMGADGDEVTIAVVLVYVAAFFGVAALFAKVKGAGILSFIAGLALIVFRAVVSATIKGETDGMAVVEYKEGWWLSVILFVVAFGLSRYICSNESNIE